MAERELPPHRSAQLLLRTKTFTDQSFLKNKIFTRSNVEEDSKRTMRAVKIITNSVVTPLLVPLVMNLVVSFSDVRAQTSSPPPTALPALEEAVTSNADVWGEAALRQPNGPSYEFFAQLLPPLRYVNADFRYYPIVLSAPASKRKARLISNGSAVNAPGGTRSWNDLGVPVTFRVGPDELRFGEFPKRLEGPRFADGYLPIVQSSYTHGESVFNEEVFASVDPTLAEHAVVMVQFSLAGGASGSVAAHVHSQRALESTKDALHDENGQTVVFFDGHWKWTRQRLVATISPNDVATLAIATTPLSASVESPLNNSGYQKQRTKAIETWQKLLERGMSLEIPEAIGQNAWRSLVIGTHTLINGERMHYSAGNQYDRLYEAEGCDAVQALMAWRFLEDVRRLAVAQLDFTRKGLEYHQAGHKLQLLADYFWQTRDAEFLRAQRPRWEKEVRRIVEGRTGEHGLFPREQYCGDVATPVFSLNSNAKCWRALRDFSEVLDELGNRDEGQHLGRVAEEFRKKIISAVETSERRDLQPAFIPIALFGEEPPYETITGTKIGSYWNLMANYVLASGVFGPGSEREKSLLEYVEQRGGLCMGLLRSRPNPTFWTGPHSVNPLYGLRRVLTLLRRDDPERSLVSFYGMLAQGLTRDTFIGGEGCSLTPLDEYGRLFYCPPNSAANGFFLITLRNLLVQDWDLDDDGKPETLRLLFATPRRWLADGANIKVQRAPTAFGEVSLWVQSRLRQGEVIAEVEAPQRQRPSRSLLRIRIPDGWRVTSAQVGSQKLRADPQGTVDISPFTGKFTLRFEVASSENK